MTTPSIRPCVNATALSHGKIKIDFCLYHYLGIEILIPDEERLGQWKLLATVFQGDSYIDTRLNRLRNRPEERRYLLHYLTPRYEGDVGGRATGLPSKEIVIFTQT